MPSFANIVFQIQIGVGDDWTPKWQWQAAINAYQNGTMTAEQAALLKAGHRSAP